MASAGRRTGLGARTLNPTYLLNPVNPRGGPT